MVSTRMAGVDQGDELLQHFRHIELDVGHLVLGAGDDDRQHAVAQHLVRDNGCQIPDSYQDGHAVQVVRIVDQSQHLQQRALLNLLASETVRWN